MALSKLMTIPHRVSFLSFAVPPPQLLLLLARDSGRASARQTLLDKPVEGNGQVLWESRREWRIAQGLAPPDLRHQIRTTGG